MKKLIARSNKFIVAGLLLGCLLLAPIAAEQQPQIPNIFLNNQAKVEGSAVVKVDSRTGGGAFAGTFEVRVSAFSAPPAYPAGALRMRIDMSDSSVVYLESTLVLKMSSHGKHTPTAYMTGRCKTESSVVQIQGCRYWISFANNRDNDEDNTTPDIISFLVLDGNGTRVAYGTGPVLKGDVFVAPTGN